MASTLTMRVRITAAVTGRKPFVIVCIVTTARVADIRRNDHRRRQAGESEKRRRHDGTRGTRLRPVTYSSAAGRGTQPAKEVGMGVGARITREDARTERLQRRTAGRIGRARVPLYRGPDFS